MSIASGTRLVGLLGVSLRDDRVEEVLQGLGAQRPAFTPDERSDVTSREHGLDLAFNAAEWARDWEQFGVPNDEPVLAALFFHGEGFENYRQYPAELPYGLSFDQSPEQVRAVLDPLATPEPGRSASWAFDHHYCAVRFTPEGRINLVTIALVSGPASRLWKPKPMTAEERAAQPSVLTADYLGVPEELDEFREVLDGLLQPAVGFGHGGVGAPLPPLTSKHGGRPDLPADLSWPTGKDGAAMPLIFQLNLTDLAERFPGRLPWPAGGGLVQLFSIEDEVDARLLVHRDLTDLRPAEAPAGVELLGERRLDPVATLTLPEIGPGEDRLETVREQLDEDQQADLEDWSDQYRPQTFQLGGAGDWEQDPAYGQAWHLDRGGERWAEPDVDFDPEKYASPYHYAQQRAIAEGWQLVAQMPDFPDQCGTFYLLAPLDAAGGWDLDRLQLIYQCT